MSGRIDVHDRVAQFEELGSSECLSEEVGEVFNRGDEWHPQGVVLHALAHEEVTTFNVLHARVGTLRASRCGVSVGWAAGPRRAALSTTTSIPPVRPAPRGGATSAGCFRDELVGWQITVYLFNIAPKGSVVTNPLYQNVISFFNRLSLRETLPQEALRPARPARSARA